MSDEKPEMPSAPEVQPPPAPKPEEALEKLRADLAAATAKADEYLDLAKRARADFLNYQDRMRREKAEWSRQAVEMFLRDFLSALDSFRPARCEDTKLMEVLGLIDREFLRVLAKQGVVPIDTAGKSFDPLYHEAVMVEEREGGADGSIIDEARRGWLIEGRVLRPAAVRIAKTKKG